MFVCLLFIWVTAGFWSGAPLLGWGSYTGDKHIQPPTNAYARLVPPLSYMVGSVNADRGYGTCEIDWAKANYSRIYKSYIVFIFIFCFFIPVLLMLFCYVSIINTVKRGNALSAEGDLTDRQRKIERDVTIVSVHPLVPFAGSGFPWSTEQQLCAEMQDVLSVMSCILV